jgi:hypothetical protein
MEYTVKVVVTMAVYGPAMDTALKVALSRINQVGPHGYPMQKAGIGRVTVDRAAIKATTAPEVIEDE